MTFGIRPLVQRLHDAEHFDVIDAHFVYPDGFAAVKLGRELGIPVILTARGTDLNLYPQFPSISLRIQQTLQSCHHLICVCEELRRVATTFDIPEEKVSVIGNGVDIERFRRGDRIAARRQLGLSPDHQVLLSIGEMTTRKGFHRVIEALAQLQQKNIQLVLIGDGRERTRLEQLVNDLKIESQVRFIGNVAHEALTPWYQAADIFVLASSREGWPNVLCEAQASGLPIVATKLWGIPEIVSDDRLGILVDDLSVESLSIGLRTALTRKWDHAEIERIGHTRTWTHVSQDLHQKVYSQLS
jgi:glycosyltransferase involved in cell wall biosynthesis